MPPGGAWVFLVNLPVCDPVKRHGRSPREHHSEEDQQNDPGARHTSGCHDHRSRSKRQREDRMRKPNEFQNSLEIAEHALQKSIVAIPNTAPISRLPRSTNAALWMEQRA